MIDNEEGLRRKFSQIGADFRVTTTSRPRYSLDIEEDRRGQEKFLLGVTTVSPLTVDILHMAKDRRHLLLLIKDEAKAHDVEKHRYLCGFDERHWFIAAVPDGKKAPTTVERAMDALKPEVVRESQRASGVRHKRRNRRHGAGAMRQGEWFFVPASKDDLAKLPIFRNEPLMRGGGKAHMTEELIRKGGTTVYVCGQYPQGVPEREYQRLVRSNPSATKWGWRVMRAEPQVYARGRIWHPDHATIVLTDWHRVYPNTESKAAWAPQMTFLD